MRDSAKKTLGIPTDDRRARQALVLRALKDKRRWAPDERCAGRVTTVATTGGGTDSTSHVYLEFDVARDGRIDRIATGERIDPAHLAQIEPGRFVTVFVDAKHAHRIGLDRAALSAH